MPTQPTNEQPASEPTGVPHPTQRLFLTGAEVIEEEFAGPGGVPCHAVKLFSGDLETVIILPTENLKQIGKEFVKQATRADVTRNVNGGDAGKILTPRMN